MKKLILTVTMVAVSIACSSGTRTGAIDETRARRTDGAKEIGPVRAKRHEYELQMQARLDKVDREIDEEQQRSKVRHRTAKAEREYKQKMAELKKIRAETRDKFSRAGEIPEDNWEEFKSDMDRAADKVEQAWKDFVAGLKS